MQLDQSPLQDCVNRQASYSKLEDGAHVFSVFVNTSGGAFVASEFLWTIDTVAPTAVVDVGQPFTNEQNVTVHVTFSEFCGGFSCTNSSFCDVSCPVSALPHWWLLQLFLVLSRPQALALSFSFEILSQFSNSKFCKQNFLKFAQKVQYVV